MSRLPWLSLEETTAALRAGTGRGVKIAMIDSGVEVRHPDLVPLELDDDLVFEEHESRVHAHPGRGQDLYGHGTALCSIVRRLAPEVQVGSFRVFGSNLRARSLLVAAAARFAIGQGYHILNCSFGSSLEAHLPVYREWTDLAYRKGRHVVGAANNVDPQRPELPASLGWVIGVTMASGCGECELRIQPGQVIELGARGEELDVAWIGGVRKLVTGSSFAVAHVTGLLARLLSVHPQLDPWTAKALLRLVAKPWNSPPST